MQESTTENSLFLSNWPDVLTLRSVHLLGVVPTHTLWDVGCLEGNVETLGGGSGAEAELGWIFPDAKSRNSAI